MKVNVKVEKETKKVAGELNEKKEGKKLRIEQNSQLKTKIGSRSIEESGLPIQTENSPIKRSSPKKSDSVEKVAHAQESTLKNQVAMYEKTMKKVQQGNIVQGTIIRVNSNEVLVDIGFKAEGVIPLSEFKNIEEAKEGNKIWVYIIKKEDDKGRPHLSKKRADEKRSWVKLEECFKTKEIVKGRITKRVRGGMIVEIDGIDAFLPTSQLSTKALPNLDHLVGKELDFKIIGFEQKKENIVVSHRIVLEEKLSEKKSSLLDKLKEGIEVDGIVKNIMDYGVFIDLGGIDGLLHISDMSWGHIKHPSEMLNIGDRVKVKVLSFDKEKERVALGLKQLVPHPWKNIEIKYPEGSKVEGKVTNITNYGAFVELEKGVEGLIHVSEMSWTHQITHPKQLLKVGDTVNTIVLSVDKEQHRISLGLKQIEPNPWLTIDVRHPVGSRITGKIKNITNFGAFIEVEKEIDGLIHISDISWIKRIIHPSEILKRGREVTAVVLSIDKVMQRISLGIKQLTPDPWEKVEELFPINSEHTVKIIKTIPKGALVSTKNDMEGFIPSSHLGIPGLDSPEFAFVIGEELPVKVIEADKDNRRLIFSVKTFFFGRKEDDINDFVSTHLERIRTKRKKAKEHEKKIDEERESMQKAEDKKR